MMLQLELIAHGAAWLAVAISVTPALIRVLQKCPHDADAFRALLWFIAGSRVLMNVVGLVYHQPAETYAEAFARSGTVALSLLCALGTLLVVYISREA